MIGIAPKNRPLSTYICGNPGNGKSSLIQRMVLHDIKRGEGVCVIDPTSDLIDTLINYIPDHRLNDVIYFDTSMPIAIDFFSYGDNPKEKENLIDDLIGIFDLQNAPRAEPFLLSVIYTLFEAKENPRMVTDADAAKAAGQPDPRPTFLDISHSLEMGGSFVHVFSIGFGQATFYVSLSFGR